MRLIKLSLASLFFMLLFSGCGTNPIQNSQVDSELRNVDSELQQTFDTALQLMRQNKTAPAKIHLQNLIDQYPQLAGPYINLGIIQLTEGNLAKAENSFTTALQIKPDSPPAHNQLGVAFRMQGKFQEAEQAYRSALKLEPDYLLAHRNLGILYDLYLPRPKLALQHYKRCQTLSDSSDKEISGWILDLERRIKPSN
ncbi:MAG: tetratricopeptide repeat protein [Candidatus Thiodiazotropha sp. (ex Lucinoma annulata)]|nr:tetratricopeptide repeat protein [Candidatus Thiodiazotropha sp. (ex Lucinoma borealis)]MCU7840423.1 tetratricopeptide repeat protein [Candidatus Thiodiazotropha sp. (ex Troendleina suluensis)]MCU7886540.1 tetratricopeptide repeat protein [Candidatus Thiodiazotropha sp. (ex Lucinoma annulata)]MCU7854486.1 tetratricopeptide repeat protein [Candidatus Thiodiazotropha sp. (ex Lucinoma borealis)]MCU7862564.1 tetratricopeptide repeat protein [Candidatus Thiodiazotropha sp. (ex Lucinoma borealis)]